MSLAALSRIRLARMRHTMAGYVERGEVPGLVTLVSRRGETQVNAFGNKALSSSDPMQRDTIFRIASLTKPLTAAAAMILVEDCVLRLDEPIDKWLPELANRQVLRRIDSALSDTVSAVRAITVRDVLTSRMGFGSIMAAPNTYPIQRSISELQIGGDGPPSPATAPALDEWLRRLGTLPLLAQPGERWMYHVSSDVLGVLVARASGQSLETFMTARLFTPLGMKDTAFATTSTNSNRLSSCYRFDRPTNAFVLFDGVEGSQWTSTPAFQSGGGGLVSTADDYLAFCQMLLNRGEHNRERILSRVSVELMMRDHLKPEQKIGTELFLGDHSGWGFGGQVITRQDGLSPSVGSFGWTGGLGTTAYTDSTEDMIGILLTTRTMDSPIAPNVFTDFWTSAYGAIDD
ncbi:MAG: beta-lactamase family protein [Gemmatimonadota bacterium]|nr:beta-lactamase family protein [Gemmatimonadota bacterium]